MKTLILIILVSTSILRAADSLAVQQLEFLQKQKNDAVAAATAPIERIYIQKLQEMLKKFKTDADAEAIRKCENMLAAAGAHGSASAGDWWVGSWEISYSNGIDRWYKINGAKTISNIERSGNKSRIEASVRLTETASGELLSLMPKEFYKASTEVEIITKGEDSDTIKFTVYTDMASYERKDAPKRTAVGKRMVVLK